MGLEGHSPELEKSNSDSGRERHAQGSSCEVRWSQELGDRAGNRREIF